MRINFDVNELQAFVAVASKASFKAAAEGLFISQPALSRRIDKLEQELGVRLLERTTRRVSLTDMGRQFLVHAQAVMDELEAAVNGVQARQFQRSTQVTVACVPSVANHLLPQVLAAYMQQHPTVRIKIIDESAQVVLDAVKTGQADFGLSFTGAQDAEIDFKAIRNERYMLVVPAQHALAAHAQVHWPMLAQERLVSVGPSSGNRVLIDNAISKTGWRPTIHCEVNHVAGALSLVAAGVGVAILPELALGPSAAAAGLVGIPMAKPDIRRTLALITRKGAVLRPPAAALVTAVRQSVQRKKAV